MGISSKQYETPWRFLFLKIGKDLALNIITNEMIRHLETYLHKQFFELHTFKYVYTITAYILFHNNYLII